MTGLNYQEKQRLKELDKKYSYILNNEGLMEFANWYSHPEKNIGVGKLFLHLYGSIEDKVISKD